MNKYIIQIKLQFEIYVNNTNMIYILLIVYVWNFLFPQHHLKTCSCIIFFVLKFII